MYKNLESYLQAVSRYLVSDNPGDIIMEIRANVLEQAGEYGEVSEDTVEMALAALGSPRVLAANYGEGKNIIAPDLRNYLFLYTSVLFVLHLGAVIIASIAGTSIAVFPFFYAPDHGLFGLLSFLPFAFIFDFGLVSLVLFTISQLAPRLNLPMPIVDEKISSRPGRGIILAQAIGLAGFAAIWYFHPQLTEAIAVQNGAVLLPAQVVFLPPMLAMAIELAVSSVQLVRRSKLVPVLGSVAAMVGLWYIGVAMENPVIFDVSGAPWDGLNRYGFRAVLVMIVVFTTIELLKRVTALVSEIHWKREVIFMKPDSRDWLNTLIRIALYIALLALAGIYVLPRFPILFFVLVVVGLLLLVRWHNTSFGFQCKKCGNEFEISTLLNLVSPHGVWSDQEGKYAWKWLRCPQCKKFSAARVIKKDR